MTYTVLGRCHRTGRVGIGIATFSITVGRYCYGVKSNAGVTVSQAFANERNNALALRLLSQGFTARSVLQQLMENDRYAEYRQIGVIDRSGTAVAHTGPHTRGGFVREHPGTAMRFVALFFACLLASGQTRVA